MKLTGIIAELMAYVLFIGLLLTYFLFTYLNRKEIWEGLKGPNKQLDTPEIVVSYWLVAFPFVAAGDFFLNLEASAFLWGSMDIILCVALGVSTYKKSKIPFKDNKDES